ncbi:hypothetical protein EsDP_00003605 [Epichloe bromicola]|uniref:Fe2OG dioxygenase domain-containing protein n=1 Tax=Epichloe bromicola TaxID=79588 RepID=A0ABQ0CP83_9HYPO
MFAFDQALLPQLTTRKALVLVDFQNDFVESDGALPASDPEGFVNRAVRLVNEFRGKGDVVWLQSQFDKPVPVDTEAIIVSNSPPVTGHKDSRGLSMAAVDPDEPEDEEAFLSQPEAKSAKIGSWGAKMISAMEEALSNRDTILTKSHYSGFNGTTLLRALRAKMVMEVFICGSMANVGVYATALDAAGHGMSITIVEDCCGYRSVQRQLVAVRNLMELTGCEIASAEEVIENLHANPATTSPQPPRSSAPTPFPSAMPTGSTQRRDEFSNPSDIVTSLAGLRLEARRPDKVAGDGAANHQASQADSEEIPQPKRQEANQKNTTPAVTADQKPRSSELIVEKDDKSIVLIEDGNLQGDGDSPNTFQPSQHSHVSTESSTMSQQAVPENAIPKEKILQKGLGEGDTDIIEDVLPQELEKIAFEELRTEVQWQRMSHQGGDVPRLVAVQGEVAHDGSMPVYRHPSDESPPLLPFSPTVLTIKTKIEEHLGHALNHVLIQFYRNGKDYISEHSDKTIDVVKSSYIANVSLGAERTMVFRTKRQSKDRSFSGVSPPGNAKRQAQRAQLPHNSLCRMGLKTNMKWLHSIRQDKRAEREKTPSELAYEGQRISLTFRHIGTFLDKDENMIWGQGATSKTRDAAKSVINGQGPEAIEMLKAFGAENNSSVFDWEARYGKGFDIIKAASDAFVADTPIRFVDNDDNKSAVDGDVAIMLYFDAVYGQSDAAQLSKADLAKRYSRFQQAYKSAELWKR